MVMDSTSALLNRPESPMFGLPVWTSAVPISRVRPEGPGTTATTAPEPMFSEAPPLFKLRVPAVIALPLFVAVAVKNVLDPQPGLAHALEVVLEVVGVAVGVMV